jgi:hypothetical protein
MLERRRGYESSSPYERSSSGGRVRCAVRRGVRRGLLRLEELGVVRRELVLRTIGSASVKMEGGSKGSGWSGVVATLDAREEDPLVTGEADKGFLKMDTGEVRIRVREGRTSSGVRGRGVPWICE